MPRPAHPKVYHITHVNNLAGMVADGVVWSDAVMIARGGPTHAIGMSEIKRRRVEELEVSVHPGTKVGDYVPFYFCPRSVMLFVIHCANNPSLTYRGGQGPIVHLESDLETVVEWAEAQNRLWAFSLSNAGARYTSFRADLDDLDALDWTAIASNDFRGAAVKEPKQSEFLLHESFPLELVERVGVLSNGVRITTQQMLAGTPYRPRIEVQPSWYY